MEVLHDSSVQPEHIFSTVFNAINITSHVTRHDRCRLSLSRRALTEIYHFFLGEPVPLVFVHSLRSPQPHSMGAACKADPTRLHIGDLRSATKDAIATKLRWHLKKLKVSIDDPLIRILYSSEKVTAELGETIPTCISPFVTLRF